MPIPIPAKEALDHVRRLIHQRPADDEDVSTDEAARGSARTDFSDEDLLRAVLRAQLRVVRAAKAQHVPNAVARFTGPFSNGSGITTMGEVVRLLYSRVHSSPGASGNLTTYDPGGFFQGTPVDGQTLFSFTTPKAFTLIDAVLYPEVAGALTVNVLLDGTVIGTTATVSDVEVPADATLSFVLSGTTTAANIAVVCKGTADDMTSEGPRAVQLTADARRRLEASGRTPTPNYPAYVYEDGLLRVYPDETQAVAYAVVQPPDMSLAQAEAGARLAVDGRLRAAVCYLAAHEALRVLGRGEESGAFQALAEDELLPYSTNTRLNTLFDDREVDVE